ncbi:hypothetical protein Tco_1088705 [Tanacetum coccineum]
MGCLPRSALFLVTESHSLTRSLNSFVFTESKWNWLKRKMKSKDARIKNEVLTSERENNRRILGVGEKWKKSPNDKCLKSKQTSGGSGGRRGNDGSRSKWNDSNSGNSKRGSFELSEITTLVNSP